MKKFLSLVLALALGVGMVVPASAAVGTIESLIAKSDLDYGYMHMVEEGLILTQTDLDGDGYRETPGLVDSGGNAIKIPSGYEIVRDGAVVSEEMFIIRQQVSGGTDTKTYKYGFMDTSGKVIVPPKYDIASGFSEGLAKVGYTSPGDVMELAPGITVIDTITQLGFIDKSGNLVIPMIYEDVSSTTIIWNESTGTPKSGFSEGLISVKKAGKWGVIDKQGNTVISFKYDLPVGSFHNGLASFSTGGKSGFMDKSGKVVIAPAYNYVQDFADGYAIVANNDRTSQYGDMLYGAINTQGKLVVPIKYLYMAQFHEGMACVSDKSYGAGKYGYVNTSGALVVPIQYTKAYAFSDSLAVVALNDERFTAPTIQNRYGYIDKQGNVAIPIEYSIARPFSDGIAAVGRNTPDHIGNDTSAHFNGEPQYLYFDTNGNQVISHGKEYGEISFSGKIGLMRQTDGKYSIVKNPCYGGATTPATVGSFSDILATSYYSDAVTWAVEKNVTSGTSATTFSPDTTCTTAQILTFLWRANGSPEPTIQNLFSDVSNSDYYAKAALWAYEQGLVSGDTFAGSTPCTRSMTVSYLWKLAGSPATGASGFADIPSGAEYAEAVAWAVGSEITSGTSATTFSPDTTCTRGQIMTFLYRNFAK